MAYYDSIYEDQELSHRAKAVYIYLKDHANREGMARQKKLCKSRQATVKGTGANRGLARAGHRSS